MASEHRPTMADYEREFAAFSHLCQKHKVEALPMFTGDPEDVPSPSVILGDLIEARLCAHQVDRAKGWTDEER